MFDPEGRGVPGAVAEHAQTLPDANPDPDAGPGRGRRVVVTGAAGFVGAHTCRTLAAQGWRVTALVRNAAKAAERLAHLPVEIRVGDLLHPPYLRASMDGAFAVVHLAAVAIERNGDTYQSANVNAASAVVAAATAANVRRVLHMSQNGSDSASPYRFLKSKGIAQDIVTSSSLEWTVLRPSVIFGPEDSFVNVLGRVAHLTPVVLPLPANGLARFQPIAVADVSRAVARSLADDTTRMAMLALGGSAQLTLREIAERALIAMRLHRIVVGVPTAVIRPFVSALWHIVPQPPVTAELLDILAIDNTVSDNALTNRLGITPIPFAPEELLYLRRITAVGALRSMFASHTA